MAAPNATRENFRKLGRAFMTAVPDPDKAVGALVAGGWSPANAAEVHEILCTLRPQVPEPRPEKRRNGPTPVAAPRGR